MMGYLRKRLLRAAAAVAGLVLGGMVTAGPTNASVVYQHEGPTYESASGIYDTSMSISGYFTVDGFLDSNLNSVMIESEILSYSFTDGVNTITNADSTADAFWASTDSGGNITAWSVDLQRFLPDSSVMIISRTLEVQTVRGEQSTTGTGTGGGGNDFNSLGIATNSTGRTATGVWTTVPASAVIPLPAALPLFGTGLGILGLFGWWRRRRLEAA